MVFTFSMIDLTSPFFVLSDMYIFYSWLGKKNPGCIFRKQELLQAYKDRALVWYLRSVLNNLYRTFKVGDTDQCPCGEEAQTAEHILQRCELYKELRVRTWPQPTLEAQKLYGCLTDLQRTAAFISETGLTIWRSRRRRNNFTHSIV